MAEQVAAPEMTPAEEMRGLIERSRAAQQQIENYPGTGRRSYSRHGLGSGSSRCCRRDRSIHC